MREKRGNVMVPSNSGFWGIFESAANSACRDQLTELYNRYVRFVLWPILPMNLQVRICTEENPANIQWNRLAHQS